MSDACRSALPLRAKSDTLRSRFPNPCKGGAEQRFAEHGSGSGAVGYRVRVESVEGLTLRVRPIAEENGEEGEGVAAEETVEKEGAR